MVCRGGLYRYDGLKVTPYLHDPLTDNSLADNDDVCILADSRGYIWVGTGRHGIDKFDPIKNIFTHFHNRPGDKRSLINNTVYAILEDKQKNIWIGTYGGLDMLDPQTGKFTHYLFNANDASGLSNNHVRVLYEDKEGTIWVGTGTPFINGDGVKPDEGGLNRFDKKTGKFIRYMHDSLNPNSLIDNRVKAIYEDRHGNFWVGTAGDGLHKMNRGNGTFERYQYDSTKPWKISRPEVRNLFPWCNDHITFITEDASGALWIGTFSGGLNRFDPDSGKVTTYYRQNLPGGFNSALGWAAFTSRDGVLWISTFDAKLFRIDTRNKDFPSYKFEEALRVYEDSGHFWIGTSNGLLLSRDQKIIKKYVYDSLNKNSISSSYINTIKKDHYGKYWISTFGGGLNYFDPTTEKFIRYQHDPNNANSIINNTILDISQDKDQNLWIATVDGIDKLNTNTGSFIHYQHNPIDSNSLSANNILCLLVDSKNRVWAGCGSFGGVNLLNKTTGRFIHYLNGKNISTLFEDADRIIWIVTDDGLFSFNPLTKTLTSIIDPNTALKIYNVVSIVEDDLKNLWLFCTSKIIRLNSNRNKFITYGKDFGVKNISMNFVRSMKGPFGDIVCATGNDYYRFFPNSITDSSTAPQIVLADLYVDEQLIQPGINSLLKTPLANTEKIVLSHNQNSFSFDFSVLHFANPDNNESRFMLENYDNTWHSNGAERHALYFNVPPRHYVFHVKAANNMGVWSEKSIEVIIVPAWWQTTWFRVIGLLVLFVIMFSAVRWRINMVRKQERQKIKSREEKLKAEREVLELEARALRAQMNPHFIFNCLNSIKSLIQQNENEKSVTYLTTFSKLIRTLLNNADKKQISLYDEIETCKLYLQLEKMRFDEKFSYDVNVEHKIDLKSIPVPALIIQPFIENAIWHGIVPRNAGGYISLNVLRKNEVIEVTVDDDGVGREASHQSKSASGLAHQSKGVNLTESRRS